MAGPISNTPNVNINALQTHNTDGNAAARKNHGIVARGVGLLNKVWLHLRGQAGPTHTRQIDNLKAQVSQEFGQDGLKALNNKISAKNWDSPNSTKLFSTSELNNLRNDAFLGAQQMRLDRRMDALNETEIVREETGPTPDQDKA